MAEQTNLIENLTSGSIIKYQDLSHWDLSGRDLSGIAFHSVNLSGVNFQRANLSGANFRFVEGSCVQWQKANLGKATFNSSDLSACDFSDANLDFLQSTNTKFNNSNFTGANLKDSVLFQVNLGESNFSDANLDSLLWKHVTLLGARLDTAKSFFTNREVVCEILSRELEGDLERAQLVGAIKILPKWCWRTWQIAYDDYPTYLQIWACEVFGKYPQSLCLEAMKRKLVIAANGDWKLCSQKQKDHQTNNQSMDNPS